MSPRRFLLTGALLLVPVLAQNGPSRWTSVKAFGVDQVDRSSLQVLVRIPLYNRPAVGHARVGLALAYSSQFWLDGGHWFPAPGNGWRLQQPSGQVTESAGLGGYCGWYDPETGDDSDTGGVDDQSGTITTYQYYFTEPDGSRIAGGGYTSVVEGDSQAWRGWQDDCPSSDDPTQTVVLPDGKGYTMVINAYGWASVYDAGGAEVDGAYLDRNGNAVTSSTSGGETTWSDPLGVAVTVTGTGTPTDPIHYTYTGPSGPAQVVERFENLQLTTSLGCGIAEWSGTLTVPSEVDYPDGSKYQFGYDSSGRLSAITLPTGGVVNYAYSIACGSFGFANAGLNRSDSVNAGGAPWAWTSTGSETIETTPAGDDSVYTFGAPVAGGESGTVAEEDAYQGSQSGGTLMRTQTITTLLGTQGQVAEQDVLTHFPGPAAGYQLSKDFFDVLGALTSSTDYDWNTSSAPGRLLRQVTNNYTLVNGTTDQLDSTVVADGNGERSKSTLAYDSSGNMYSENDTVAGTQVLTHTYSYFSNGTLKSAIDPNGGELDYTNGACGGAFPTQVKSLQIPLAVNTSIVWDCNGGVMTSSTDQNGQTTSTGFDSMWRPITLAVPSMQVTYFGYAPNTSEQATTFNSGVSTVDVLTVRDGLGRPVLEQRRQAPGVDQWDTVETVYDAQDRPSQTSRPFTSTGGSGNGTIFSTTAYDALSRPVKITGGDGSATNISYVQNATETIAPGGVSRIQVSDGLGRLIEVCEVTAQAGSAGCGAAIAGSGWVTNYARNGAGQITQVNQGVEQRNYNFDELGRLTSEVNPENGMTSYFYDGDSTCGNSNGDLLRRVDANGNTNCYVHDALHRVTQVQYPSGPNHGQTSTKHFIYDAATLPNGGAVMQNVQGKLAEAYTGDAHTTDLGFSYPNPGASEVDVYQSSTDSGGWYKTTAQHYANGATSVLTLPTGVPAITYSLDGEGRPTTVLAGSTNLVKSASYGADGLSAIAFGSNDSDAYQYDAKTGRMTQYNFYVGANVNVGTLGWNPDGTLGSLALSNNIFPSGPSTTCNYLHDDLGRIAKVDCPGVWTQTFTLDRYGNVRKDATTGTSFSADFNLANQISSVGGVAGVYDANGNLINDPAQSTSSVNSYDSENKAVTLEGTNVLYDALGRAAEAAEPSGSIEFLYGADGGKIAVMAGQTLARADIPLPGGAEAVYAAGGLTAYRHADQLGSAPLASTPLQTVWSAVGYAPYGEAFSSTGSDRSFTGQKADINGDQYDFLMREYNPVQGRWWTPDPAGLAAVDPNNPQSWNRYAYVNGTPLNSTDPLGLCHTAIAQNGATVYVTDAAGPCPDLPSQVFTVQDKPQPLPMDQDVGINDIATIDYLEAIDRLHPHTTAPSGSGATPNPPFKPLPAKFPAPQVSNAAVHSRSYGSFVACEFGAATSDSHSNEVTGLVNVAPLYYIGSGNVPRAAWALVVMAAYDIGGAWVINRQCSEAVYGGRE